MIRAPGLLRLDLRWARRGGGGLQTGEACRWCETTRRDLLAPPRGEGNGKSISFDPAIVLRN